MQKSPFNVIAIDDQRNSLQSLRTMLLSENHSLSAYRTFSELLNSQQMPVQSSGDESTERQEKSSTILLISLDLAEDDPMHVYDKLLAYYPHSHFAFISKAFDPHKVEKLLSLGVQAFFTKPINYKEFMKWAEEITESREDTALYIPADALTL